MALAPPSRLARMAFHLGPDAARLELPGGLERPSHRGEAHPILGWYSAELGERVAAVTLLGQSQLHARHSIRYVLDSVNFAWAVSSCASNADFCKLRKTDAEAR